MTQTRAGRSALDRGIRLWLDHLRVERGASANTLDAYTRDLERWSTYLAEQGISDAAAVAETHVTGFVEWLRTPAEGRRALAASSAGRALVAVRGLHAFLLEEGLTETDPAREVSPPRPPSRLPKALSLGEVERLLEAASLGEGAVGLRDRALLEVLYGTGARVSEACGLDLDDVDLEHRVVRLVGKGDKERRVPLGSFACEALEAWLVRGRPGLSARGRGGPAVLLNQRGARLSRQSAWEIMRTAGGRAGITAEIGPHTMRHSFATHLLEGGADVRVVQELLGHASVATTQIYTMVTVQQLREVFASSHPRAR